MSFYSLPKVKIRKWKLCCSSRTKAIAVNIAKGLRKEGTVGKAKVVKMWEVQYTIKKS